MIHARPDYQNRIQDIDILALKALFEEMLESLKADYLAPWTDSKDGVVHPAGLDRWARDERYYRGAFAKIMTGKIPAAEPVFLLRGQDAAAVMAINTWITMTGGILKGDPTLVEAARAQLDRIEAWPKKKTADGPKEITV